MSPIPRLSDADFINQFRKIGPNKLARKLGLTRRGIYARRRRIEELQGVPLSPPPHATGPNLPQKEAHPGRINITVRNGVVIVGSDAHYWPGQEPSTAHRALVKFTKEFKPAVVVQNGDVMDFPKISRHPPIGWESTPDVADEIENAQDRLHEIAVSAGRARKIWTLGNHDARFETRLATVGPEYAQIHGVHLRDHFPLWEPCWSVWINDVVIKHRFKGGIHAPHNNTVNSGRSIVTGHLHSQKVTPFTDYNGTRYGVDSGCIADPDGKQFVDYTEDSPKNWRSGFIILTFIDGKLILPELVQVSQIKKDHVEFRGSLHKV